MISHYQGIAHQVVFDRTTTPDQFSGLRIDCVREHVIAFCIHDATHYRYTKGVTIELRLHG